MTVDPTRVNGQIQSIVFFAMPYIALCLLLLLLLVILANYRSAMVLEALMGMLSILLSMIAAITFLFALKAQFNPMVTVTPFLTLGIGIDDAFLLIQVIHPFLLGTPISTLVSTHSSGLANQRA